MVYWCIDYINIHADMHIFEHIFNSYKKNIDYSSPNLEIVEPIS